ncbi:MAG TPA: alpha/beta fold hydrolase [Jatrophihabitans sp.]|nr:alpha/beta fold hydrolase [Jatrophihabitans sp.]
MTISSTDRLIELLELRRTTLQDLDGTGRMLVTNDETGSAQLYEISPDGQWRQLTDLGEPCSGRYLPGTRSVVVSADTGGTERAQLSLLRICEQGLGELSPLVHDPAYIHALFDVRDDVVVYATNRRDGVEFDVIERRVSDGTERVLFDGGGYFDSAVPSPDGRWVLLSRMTTIAASSELLLVDTASGAVRSITDPGAPGAWDNPKWLADSSGLLASTDTHTDFFAVHRYDVEAATWSSFLGEDGVNLFVWPAPAGDRLAVVRTVDGIDSLTIRDAGGDHPVELPGQGVLTSRTRLAWSPDAAVFGFTFSSMVQPPEVHTWQPGDTAARRRTTSNPAEATAGLVDLSSHLVPTPDGEQIPTYLLRPEHADGSAVLIIHGGPEAAVVATWSPVAAALALAGHTVLLPNVRGSAGYGRRWVSLDDIDKRLDSVADLVALRDWLPSVGVDTDRVALYGGSYGGYMVLAGLAYYPELWAAGVDIVGVSSLVTFLQNTSAYRRAYREREYGRLVEDRDLLEQASPFNRIDAIRAPLFVIHGANDPRVPLSEAEQVVAAVRASGADCPFLVYDDEGHGLAKRANQLDAYPQVIEFLAKHLAR